MRILHSSIRRALLCGVFAASANELESQSASSSLPADLVTALLAGPGSVGGSAIKYYVGAPPPGWPSALLPAPPAVIVGGRQGTPQLTAVFADSTVRLPLSAYVKRIEDAGWTKPAADNAAGFQREDARYGFWCSDSARVTASLVPGVGSMAYVRVTYLPMPRGTCVPTPGGSADRSRPSLLTLPVLRPPAGARFTMSGGGSSSNSLQSNARLIDATIDAAQVLAHYSAQLTAAGWRAFAPALDTTLVAQLFEARDDSGTTWRGTLLVVPNGTTRDVTLMMSRPDTR